MPLCTVCKRTTPSRNLRRCGEEVKCPRCRINLSLVEDSKMAEEKAGRKVFSVHINEHETEKGVDHLIAVEASYGGLDLRFKSTIDQVREFFTERRVEGKGRLEALK